METLHGMLPICVHCKRVREDEGYWTRIEELTSARADVLVSHALCETCYEKHHSEERVD